MFPVYGSLSIRKVYTSIKTTICTSWHRAHTTSDRRTTVLVISIWLHYIPLIKRVFNNIACVLIRILLTSLTIRKLLAIHLFHVWSIIARPYFFWMLRNENLIFRYVISRSYILYALFLMDFLASLLNVAYLGTL